MKRQRIIPGTLLSSLCGSSDSAIEISLGHCEKLTASYMLEGTSLLTTRAGTQVHHALCNLFAWKALQVPR